MRHHTIGCPVQRMKPRSFTLTARCSAARVRAGTCKLTRSCQDNAFGRLHTPHARWQQESLCMQMPAGASVYAVFNTRGRLLALFVVFGMHAAASWQAHARSQLLSRTQPPPGKRMHAAASWRAPGLQAAPYQERARIAAGPSTHQSNDTPPRRLSGMRRACAWQVSRRCGACARASRSPRAGRRREPRCPGRQPRPSWRG